MTIRIHGFDSTDDAYTASQCDEKIKLGDILLILSEKIVGVSDTWPMAITVSNGNLRAPLDDISPEDLNKSMNEYHVASGIKIDFIQSFKDASTLAKALGYEICKEFTL